MKKLKKTVKTLSKRINSLIPPICGNDFDMETVPDFFCLRLNEPDLLRDPTVKRAK
ncbi:MAG: hypothetical protein IJB86_08080 [Clostridia bacterium]|nr:hypothetical protein [Clostridia bacterium]